MTVRRDAIGNVIGRLGDGRAADPADRLSPRHGPRRGPLRRHARGARRHRCLERLRDEGRSLPYAIEVLAFADEEGVRYGTGYLGSSVIAGRFDTAIWSGAMRTA